MKNYENYKKSVYQKANIIIGRRKRWKRYIITASSFAASLTLIICVLSILPNLTGSPLLQKKPPHNPYNKEINSIDKAPNHNFQGISMNAISGYGNVERLHFSREETYEEIWNWDKIMSYLGHDITPTYLMDGLQKNTNLSEQAIIFNKDGTLAYDAIWLEYYTEYEDDGSQVIGFNSTGIRIVASKLGHLDYVYIWPDNIKESLIDETPVKFGYVKGDGGGTAENPEKLYDLYIAEFLKDDVNYQVVSSNINENEFVKMVISLISQ